MAITGGIAPPVSSVRATLLCLLVLLVSFVFQKRMDLFMDGILCHLSQVGEGVSRQRRSPAREAYKVERYIMRKQTYYLPRVF